MDSGVEKKSETNDPDLLIDEFSYSLSETCKRITNPEKGEEKKDGIIFFIDEADNSSPELHVGYFFKAVTEMLQQNGCNNVMFVVAGLPEVVERLSASHESSLRVFAELRVKELNVEDRHYVIEKGTKRVIKSTLRKQLLTKKQKSIFRLCRKATHISFSNLLILHLILIRTGKYRKRTFCQARSRLAGHWMRLALATMPHHIMSK
jgi:hypothetical protein